MGCGLRARTPRESNIYARIGNHPICSGLSCVPTFSVIPTPAGGRTGAAGCVSWPPATCACGAVAPLASARPRRADGHRTPPLTPPSTGPARRGPRRVTPPTRHGPTRHCPRARVLSEARLVTRLLTMIRTACAKVKPPSAPTSAPTRLASSLSRPTLLRATPTPRSDGADVDGAVGPERCCEQARARHRALVGTYDPRSWPK